jgi:hypothetical protein
MWTWIEKMSVASAWSLALKWLCQTAATPCASTVTATGIYDLITFLVLFPIWSTFDL